MRETVIALLVFVSLMAASFGSQFLYGKSSRRHFNDQTHALIRQVASLFVVLAALVLGLATNSARSTLESVDRNIHSLATDLILLDRTLQQYGPETSDARQRLFRYTERAARTLHDADPNASDQTAERLLNDVGASLSAINPKAERLQLWNEALSQFRKIVELRWILVEQSEGTIPTALIVLLGLWLALIFGSFGYQAPRNAVVAVSLTVAAALLAGTIYLILDMDIPFTGPIQVSAAPLERAAAEMRR